MKLRMKRNALQNELSQAVYFRGRQLLAESEWATDGLQSAEWYAEQWKKSARLVANISTSSYSDILDHVFAEGRKEFEDHVERAEFLKQLADEVAA